MKTIRLMLVDDHDVVRAGLKSYLESHDGFVVVAEASTGEAAIDKVLEARPEVIIMDISMPEMSGLDATRRLKAIYPECQVLALTVHQDKQYFFEMLAAGATGYITKQAAPEELVAAVRSVSEGNVYLQPVLARWLLEDYHRLLITTPAEPYTNQNDVQADKDLKVLTKRERQVLEAVAQGMTSPQIGELLGISPKTVARHRERIMNKLNLHSAADLVKYAIRTGLIKI
jgi:two-component system response regulator NreC